MRELRRLGLITSVAILLMYLASSRAFAGSIVYERLGSLEQVRVYSPTGLQYRPIPGLDLLELKRRSLSRIVEILEAKEVKVSEAARARLFVTLTKEELEDCSRYAIIINVQLVESARLDRYIEGRDGPETTGVITWDRVVAVISSADSAMGDIISEIESVAEIFAGDVAAARWNSERTEETSSAVERKGDLSGSFEGSEKN